MKKSILLIAVPFMFFMTLTAQTTQEQANEIVLQYILNEITTPCLLYVHNHEPSAENMVITTFKEEIIKVKYPCWVYYLNEHPNLTEPCQHRYLFVKEDNGNLLEIITASDLGITSLTEWTQVPTLGINVFKENAITIYPNPTTGELKIENGELKIENVEIFDIYGRKLKSKIVNLKSKIVIDISHLHSGIYFVKITTEAGEVVRKVVKQ